jgi:hypothetical protein
MTSAQPAKADIAPGSHSSPSLKAQGFLAVFYKDKKFEVKVRFYFSGHGGGKIFGLI